LIALCAVLWPKTIKTPVAFVTAFLALRSSFVDDGVPDGSTAR
jgi:hypothetical protein